MDKATIIQSAITTLMAMFAGGNFPAQVAMTIIRKAEGDTVPSDSWSLGNRLLMGAQATSDARGFRQWGEVGRHVKKGSKAIHIFAPLTKKNPSFFDVAEKLGVKVEYKALRSDYYGRYTSGQGKIELCSEDAVVYYHELAHAVHDTFVDLRTCDKEKKEIIAELSALVLAEISGVSGYQWQGFKYISAYCADSKPETVLKKMMGVLNDVEKIVSIVLDASEDKIRQNVWSDAN